MTLRTNARLAGGAFLLYIVAGIASMALAGRPPARELLGILTSLCALVLGVTLYAITRRCDRDLAMLALACRIVEAAPGEGAMFFAIGSTIFSWLLLRGRMIPIALARLGVIASVLLVLVLPAQTAGLLGGRMGWSSAIGWIAWLPMLIFEVSLAFWLIVRGVARQPSPLQARSMIDRTISG